MGGGLPAGKVSAGDSFELFGFREHHGADLISRFLAHWREVLDEWPPHDLPQRGTLAEFDQWTRAMASNPIDSFDGAPGNRAGARRGRSRIYLHISNPGPIQRDATCVDEIA